MNSEQAEIIKNWLGTGSINIFGKPFAGKDTVCQWLATEIEGVVLGGGDILRNSTIPEHVKAYLDKGLLIPTEDYIQIVLPYLGKDEFRDKPLVLSSVGRWIGEEQGVLQATKQSGHDTKAVLYLDISDETALERLRYAKESGQRASRSDDTEETLHRRLDEYTQKTIPVIKQYDDLGLLTNIDGSLSVEGVRSAIVEALYKKVRS